MFFLSKTPEEDSLVDRYGLNPAPYWVVTLAGATVLFGLLAYSGYQGKIDCSILAQLISLNKRYPSSMVSRQPRPGAAD